MPKMHATWPNWFWQICACVETEYIEFYIFSLHEFRDIYGIFHLHFTHRLFGEPMRREAGYVLCGGKGTAPGCALKREPKGTKRLERMISPRTLDLGIEGEAWFQKTAIALAEDKDGHIVGVLIALLMAAATGRMDLAVAGLFGAGKSRAAAVAVIGTLIINP